MLSVCVFLPLSVFVDWFLFLEVKRSVDATVMPVLSTSCGTKRDKSMSWTSVVQIWNKNDKHGSDRSVTQDRGYLRPNSLREQQHGALKHVAVCPIFEMWTLHIVHATQSRRF